MLIEKVSVVVAVVVGIVSASLSISDSFLLVSSKDKGTQGTFPVMLATIFITIDITELSFRPTCNILLIYPYQM